MPKNRKRTVLKYGDTKYIMGSKTKVKVIGGFEHKKPLCEILETGPTSKYLIGDVVDIPRNILYPYRGLRRN